MDATDILEAMKRMEWQKAKGHLLAMLETYHSMPDRDGIRDTKAYDEMYELAHRFVANVEGLL